MKLFVNFLSLFRICAAFAIIPTLMLQWYWVTLILFALGAISDWLDGFLARKFNVCTKLGGVLDHIGDKLLVVNTFIMLAMMMRFWFVIIPIILMIARELYISGLREFLGTQKIEMPVPKNRFSMGKIKTTLQMLAILSFLMLFAVSTIISPDTISSKLLITMNVLSQAGIIFIWFALVASLWSATQYTFTFLEKIKKIKK
ncbi:MAG: CDP-diacylglycerol--glycerol-3-phosphate 3-phosphatidyltransferase [Alphaproteobacteria bacterium]|nr:CDP-diacylglycerol--glycerol-3-phosphate 3-phosphatidyltransferase [Alphaproteobacteria bacterium]